MHAGELEIGLRWSPDQDGFDVTLHASTDEDIKHFELPQEPFLLDTNDLGNLLHDPMTYADRLTTAVFGISGLQNLFIGMVQEVEHRQIPLHLRLMIDRTAPAHYHTVRWELLKDPRNGQPLSLNPFVTVTRFVNPRVQSALALRPTGHQRALIVAADPEPETLRNYGLTGRPLAPINAREEANVASKSLASFESTIVHARGESTLRRIAAKLKSAEREGQGYSIVYVIAHGALHEQGPVLYLEGEQGNVAPVSGSSFVQAVTELERRPSLVVLAACETASSDPGVATSMGESATALGPMLVADGIPAVLAMHGRVSVDTVRLFMPAFLSELHASGSVYQALLEGRKAVRERDDWWAPVLFTRLRTGMISYTPKVAPDWAATKNTVVQSIHDHACTAIVGPGLSTAFFPSRSAVAAGMAKRLQVPIAPGASNDLARICQYLAATHQDRRYPRSALIKFLIERLEEQGGLSEAELGEAAERAETRSGGVWLKELAVQAGRKHRADHEDDPYAALAELGFSVYFTTSYTAMLEDALDAVGRTARVIDYQTAGRTRNSARSKPSVEKPTVVRLFGGFEEPDSLVLTEDDYFNYLTKWATGDRVNALRGHQSDLTNNNLVLLGFGLDDWDFRVLFRSILSMGGATRSMGGATQLQVSDLAHVAVQVNPQSETIEADAVQEYLERYYRKEGNVSVRWATPSELLKELKESWSASHR